MIENKKERKENSFLYYYLVCYEAKKIINLYNYHFTHLFYYLIV